MVGLGLSQVCLSRGAGDAPVPRFRRAFRSVDVAIDYPEVGQSPKIEQSRPRRVSVFAPDPKQRDALVNFGASPHVRSIDLWVESSCTEVRPRGTLPTCTIIM